MNHLPHRTEASIFRLDQRIDSGLGEHPRRGSLLVVFMISLLLMTLTFGVLIRTAVLHRKHTRLASARTQVEWLADSAVARAAVHLRSEPEWSGEKWNVPAEQIGGSDAAAGVIEVTSDDSLPRRRIVSVVIDCPPEGPGRIRAVRSIEVDLGGE